MFLLQSALLLSLTGERRSGRSFLGRETLRERVGKGGGGCVRVNSAVVLKFSSTHFDLEPNVSSHDALVQCWTLLLPQQ